MEKLSSNTEEDGTESIPLKMSSDQQFQDELSGVSDVSEDDEIELMYGHESSPRSSLRQLSRTLVGGLKTRWEVVKQIWRLTIAIFANYFVTLLVFPGLVSEVQYCRIGDWTPIVLIAVFNVTDFVAKWLALLRCASRWPSSVLMIASMSRFILVPLLLLCIVPSPSSPVIGGGAVVAVAVMFNFLLGLTNGYFGSLPMINVTKEVKKNKDRELAGTYSMCLYFKKWPEGSVYNNVVRDFVFAGTIMTWVLLLALMLGSVLAYALTPLTNLADHVECDSNNTLAFICNHGNATLKTMTSP